MVARYCDEYVCVFVCLTTHISKTTRPNCMIVVHVAVDSSSNVYLYYTWTGPPANLDTRPNYASITIQVDP